MARTADVRHQPEESMAGGFLEGSSFVLCDANSRGFPIRYASKGFEEVFGYQAAEWTGKSCGELIGGSALSAPSHISQLFDAASVAGLSEASMTHGVEFLTHFVGKEAQRVASEGLDSSEKQVARGALLVNRRKCGALLTCQLIMRRCRHPALGWPYLVGLQRDVSDEVSVGRLLQAVANGTYADLLAERRASFEKQGKLLDHPGTAPVLNEKADGMWKAAMAGTLSPGDANKPKKKAADACSLASRSTASGASSKSFKSVSSVASGASTTSWKAVAVPQAEPAISTPSCAEQNLPTLGFHIGAIVRGQSSPCRESATGVCQVGRVVEEEDDDGQHDDDHSDFQGRFFDLLEAVEGSKSCGVKVVREADFECKPTTTALENNCNDFKGCEDEGCLQSDIQGSIDFFGRKEVRDLEFPLLICDPALPGCPVVSYSVGFSELTGYSTREALGQGVDALLFNSVPPHFVESSAKADFQAYCETAQHGESYFARHGNPENSPLSSIGTARNLSDWVAPTLAHGELMVYQTASTKSGGVFRSLFYWKQAELDEKSCFYGVLTPIVNPSTDSVNIDSEMHGHNYAKWGCSSMYNSALELMTVAEQVLAAQFWYSAPMRRQMPVSDLDDIDSNYGSART